jgi:hypothetical protein
VLAVEQGYSILEPLKATDVRGTVMHRWFEQLKAEHRDVTPTLQALTATQQHI